MSTLTVEEFLGSGSLHKYSVAFIDEEISTAREAIDAKLTHEDLLTLGLTEEHNKVYDLRTWLMQVLGEDELYKRVSDQLESHAHSKLEALHLPKDIVHQIFPKCRLGSHWDQPGGVEREHCGESLHSPE